ncbi:MAG TPA: hypothetical protein VNV41_09565 [Candidatus Acidoferrales bacterium]|nr:hypothetical protein [Candidatus Acidoferrales bacterium]
MLDSLRNKDELTVPMGPLDLFNGRQAYGFAHTEPVRAAMSRPPDLVYCCHTR